MKADDLKTCPHRLAGFCPDCETSREEVQERESARLPRWECPEHGNDAIAYVPPGPAVCKFVTNAGQCTETPVEVVYVRFDSAREAYVRVRDLAERLAEALDAALEEMRSMDLQIDSEWGVGKYTEAESITAAAGALAEYRAVFPKAEEA